MDLQTFNLIQALRTNVRYTRSFYSGHKSDAKFFPLSAVEERLQFACFGYVQAVLL